MTEDKMIEFSISPTEKKNCWDVEKLELDQDLLECTGFEGKCPNWNGQIKKIYNGYRWGSFSINEKI